MSNYDAIAMYLRQLKEMPQLFELGESWLADRLAKCRIGNEQATRDICGSCLRIAWELAQEYLDGGGDDNNDILDVVQDANAALLRAVKSFEGSTIDALRKHVVRVIRINMALSRNRTVTFGMRLRINPN